MREIEVKAALREKEKALQRLTELGCVFQEPDTEHDTVFVQKVGDLTTYLSNSLFLRIREKGNGDVLFTVKFNPSRSVDATAVPTEHEVRVDSREEVEGMLALLGFTEAVRIQKRRQKGRYNGWEICIDEVEGLGSFIELEKLAEHGTDELAVQDEMRAFLRSLGIAEEDLKAQRYDTAMLGLQ